MHRHPIHLTMSCRILPILALLRASLMCADYHLDPAGDDARDGLSPQTAWRSLERAGRQAIAPGDRILLKGGGEFSGGLLIAAGGSEANPLTIAGYGEGRARITATDPA